MENQQYREIIDSIHTLSKEMAEFKGFYTATSQQQGRRLDSHSKDIDDLGDDITELRSDLASTKKTLGETQKEQSAQLRLAKLIGIGLIAVLGVIELWILYAK